MLKKLLPIMFLFVGFQANAALVTVLDSGDLIGFDGISLNNEIYDVRFVEGTFFSVFGDASGLDFADDPVGAKSASTALMNAFNDFPTYDHTPNLTFGLGNINGYIWTPYWQKDNIVKYMYFHNVSDILQPNSNDQVWAAQVIASYDTLGPNDFDAVRVWADWSVATESVPEPSVIALFAAGLFGIGFARRRKA